MTFVLALIGKKSVWLLTDRRLTSAHGFTDDGIKTVHFDGSDGQGFMGYAGLGRTARRRQPSDWMKDQLVGRSGLTVEQSIGTVADAVKAQLPKHLRGLPTEVAAHDILIPAVVAGKPRLYHIGINASRFLYTQYQSPHGKSPNFAVAGSGAMHLPNIDTWHRPLLRMLARFEKGHVGGHALADKLAEMNALVAECDRYVSSKCVVSWRMDGGGTQFYDGRERAESDGEIPTVGNGMDVQAIVRASLPSFLKQLAALREGRDADIDGDEINEALKREHRPPKRDLR